MRVLVAEPLGREGLELLRAEHEVDERLKLTRDELLTALPDYDALLVRSQVKVDAEAIAAGRRLAVIGRAGVGTDNIDLDAATSAGIAVVNAPTANTIAAAELTLALMFSLARNVAQADASLRRGEWRRADFVGIELGGKTLGIVGLGKIGLAVAARAVAMDMTLLANDPYANPDVAENAGVRMVELDELLAKSDVVTLHVPLSDATRGMIGPTQLAMLKSSALLVNVARGGVVDEAALADALATGRLAGAAIDVYAQEPPRDSPLMTAPHTVLTPHLGASTTEAQAKVSIEVVEQLLDVLAGRPARFQVNRPLERPATKLAAST